jgi:hypothetical protein
MEPDENRIAPDAVAAVPIGADIGRDRAATLPPVAPAVVRHHFTLTVDRVSVELFDQGFGRDDRTIQRWCKAGKLRAIVDELHGDRYLIDPTSLRYILAALVAERDSRTARPFLSFQICRGDTATILRQCLDAWQFRSRFFGRRSPRRNSD